MATNARRPRSDSSVKTTLLRTWANRAAATVTLLAAASPMLAQSDWHIETFDVRLEIQADGALRVTETIAAVFDVRKHGIYRTIPVRYQVALHQYSLRFTLLGVTDESGQPIQRSRTRFICSATSASRWRSPPRTSAVAQPR